MISVSPEVTLAFTIRSAPGVFVPVLGSGVSRAAGIPTGWEIVLDLVSRLAHTLGEETADPEDWYRKRYGTDPDYSEVIDRLGTTPSERNLLLRKYFEASEEDRTVGRKIPTRAHRAIAKLVAKGYVRVVITTNFDRLLEVALEGEGVHPQVISTSGSLAGALPVIHAPCTVVKVNGDYLDTRFRNTAAELSRYDRAIVRFLRTLFEEHGLIICGWSGEWDIELRRALESTANRRFATYWCARTDPSPSALNLITLRGFTVVQIDSADDFFTTLASKVEALEESDRPYPLTARLAAAEVKRLITNTENRIRLADTLMTEAAKLSAQLSEERQARRPEGSVPHADVLVRAAQYEARGEVLSVMLACGGYWGENWTSNIWTRTFNIVADGACDQTYTSRSVNLVRYAVLFLLYTAGTAAMAGRRFDNLKAILITPQRRTDSRNEPLTLGLEARDIFNGDEDLMRALRPRREWVPLSNHLFESVRPALVDLHLTEGEYEENFLRFEYFRSLVHADLFERQFGRAAAEAGRFVKMRGPLRENVDKVFEQEIERAGESWSPLQLGFFDGSLARLIEIKKVHDQQVEQLRMTWW